MNIGELLAALPEEDSSLAAQPEWAQAQLQEIMADLAKRPLPTGSLHRLWTVSELSAQIALAYWARLVRHWFPNGEGSQQREAEANLRVALKVLHRLGYLRGAMTKVGQAIAHLPGLVPVEVAETLDRLHFEAPPMHYPLIREVFRNEFGHTPEEMFLEFEKDAFAAASIGQVHRARLKSGERVAVKIQYPGIARAIDADFRNLSALLLPLRLGNDWEYAKGQFEEIRRMLTQEIDYVQEAETTRRACELFRPEDGIVVPRVYGEFSGKRVLTTEYIEGLHLTPLMMTDPSQELRNDFGAKIQVAWERMYYAFMPYADPNPGNYLFLKDGRLGLIDFGCVQHFGQEEREIMLLAEEVSFDPSADLHPLLQRVCGLAADDPAWPDYLEMMKDSRDWMMEPIDQPGPFNFGDAAHFQRGLDWFSRAVRKRTTRSHPMYVYWNRSTFGIQSLLFRLGAVVDIHAIIRRERPPRYKGDVQ